MSTFVIKFEEEEFVGRYKDHDDLTYILFTPENPQFANMLRRYEDTPFRWMAYDNRISRLDNPMERISLMRSRVRKHVTPYGGGPREMCQFDAELILLGNLMRENKTLVEIPWSSRIVAFSRILGIKFGRLYSFIVLLGDPFRWTGRSRPAPTYADVIYTRIRDAIDHGNDIVARDSTGGEPIRYADALNIVLGSIAVDIAANREDLCIAMLAEAEMIFGKNYNTESAPKYLIAAFLTLFVSWWMSMYGMERPEWVPGSLFSRVIDESQQRSHPAVLGKTDA